MHTSEKRRRGKQQISHRESERMREREEERDALGLTIFEHVLFCLCEHRGHRRRG